MKDLTPEEIAALPWVGGEKFALVDRGEGNHIVYTADSKEWLLSVLEQMTPRHPLYPRLQLVEKP